MRLMTELLDSVLGLAIFFLPSITAFVLVTSPPLRRLRQPLKFFSTHAESEHELFHLTYSLVDCTRANGPALRRAPDSAPLQA